MTKKWTDDDTRWLKTNVARLDVQTLALKLAFPLEEVEKRIRQLKLVSPPTAAARGKRPPR